MKKLSLQWRITLMTVLLIGITCVSMNLLICCSGRHYMDSIGTYISETDNTDKDKQEFFVPDRTEPDQQLTIIIDGAQEAFIATNWYITAAVTLLSGVIAYFLSGHTLKPLRRFASQVEQIHPNNLSDMKFSEDVLPEFQKFSSSFNRMLDRLDDGFTAQRQFTGNAA
ncbi:MAG: two-component sensor histidine kinase, partial [Anaerovoracaceae bacterium]|nr:two-component sensor histidine kinase [Anaerovoracaceae bacterium]